MVCELSNLLQSIQSKSLIISQGWKKVCRSLTAHYFSMNSLSKAIHSDKRLTPFSPPRLGFWKLRSPLFCSFSFAFVFEAWLYIFLNSFTSCLCFDPVLPEVKDLSKGQIWHALCDDILFIKQDGSQTNHPLRSHRY